MRKAYPTIMTPTDGIYMIRVPDMDIDTQGNDLTDAIEMARDAIDVYKRQV